jgi:AcrR family transcriptional regulator
MNTASTLNRLKEQERETRRLLIIDAARRLFGDHAYDAVSMADIARTAGIAKSSIYTYFASQEDLFVEVVVRDSEQFLAQLEHEVSETRPNGPGPVMRLYLDYYFHQEAQWRMITRFALHGNIGKDASHRLNKVSRRLMDLLEQSIAGHVSAPDDARLLAHALFSMLSGILIAFRKYPGRSESERLAHIRNVGRIMEQMLDAYLYRFRSGDTRS